MSLLNKEVNEIIDSNNWYASMSINQTGGYAPALSGSDPDKILRLSLDGTQNTSNVIYKTTRIQEVSGFTFSLEIRATGTADANCAFYFFMGCRSIPVFSQAGSSGGKLYGMRMTGTNPLTSCDETAQLSITGSYSSHINTGVWTRLSVFVNRDGEMTFKHGTLQNATMSLMNTSDPSPWITGSGNLFGFGVDCGATDSFSCDIRRVTVSYRRNLLGSISPPFAENSMTHKKDTWQNTMSYTHYTGSFGTTAVFTGTIPNRKIQLTSAAENLNKNEIYGTGRIQDNQHFVLYFELSTASSVADGLAVYIGSNSSRTSITQSANDITILFNVQSGFGTGVGIYIYERNVLRLTFLTSSFTNVTDLPIHISYNRNTVNTINVMIGDYEQISYDANDLSGFITNSSIYYGVIAQCGSSSGISVSIRRLQLFVVPLSFALSQIRTVSATKIPGPKVEFSDIQLFGKKNIRKGIVVRYKAGYHGEDPLFFYKGTGVRALRSTDTTGSISLTTGAFYTDASAGMSIELFGYYRANIGSYVNFFLNTDDGSYLWTGDSALSGWSNVNATIANGGIGSAKISGLLNCVSGSYYPLRVNYGNSTSTGTFQFYRPKPRGIFSCVLANCDYTGPIFKLRRDLDNATLDFFSDAVGAIYSRTTDYTSWISGSTNIFVDTWYDQSGLSNNATQPTLGLQPRYVFSTKLLDFGSPNTTANFLIPSGTVPIGTQTNGYSVTIRHGVTSGANTFYAAGATSTDNGNVLRSNSSSTAYINYWNSNNLSFGSFAEKVAGNVVTVVYDGTSRKGYINGVLKASETKTPTSISSGQQYIGRSLLNTEFLAGELYYLYIYEHSDTVDNLFNTVSGNIAAVTHPIGEITTSNTSNILYVASASSNNVDAFKAFNTNSSSISLPGYSSTTRLYTGSKTTSVDGSGILGEYVTLECQTKLTNIYQITYTGSANVRSPEIVYAVASNDDINYTLLNITTGATTGTNVAKYIPSKYYINSYRYLRFIATKLINTGQTSVDFTSIQVLAEQGPEFLTQGITLNASNLEFWIDAQSVGCYTITGSGISQINDLSGNARHVVQTTDAERPLFSPVGLNNRESFDMRSQKSLNVSFNFSNGAKTVVSVVSVDSSIQTWGSFMTHGNRDTDLSSPRRLNTNTELYSIPKGAGDAKHAYTTNLTSIWIMTTDASSFNTLYRYQNGVLSTSSFTNAITASTSGTKTLLIGKSDNNEYCNSYIGEIQYYTRTFNIEEVKSIAGYLARKWNCN